MAKAFDDNERKLIKDKLKEGALLFYPATRGT